jgi:Putative phage tail protein
MSRGSGTLPGIGTGGPVTGLGIGGNSRPAASVTPSFTLIDPPDDRYMPGYSKVDENGNVTNVGPRLKDLNVSFSLYGLPIPISHGVRRLPGNIIWAEPLREARIKKKSGGTTAGKGGGGGPWTKNITFVYYATFAVSFGYARSPDSSTRQIIRVWADGNLVSDRRQTSRGKSVNGFKYRFYPGTPTQQIDPVIEEDLGVGGTPAYRDLMYLVVEDVPVAQFGNRLPALTVEIGDITTPVATDFDLGLTLPGDFALTGNIMVDWASNIAIAKASGTTNAWYECDLNVGYVRTIEATDNGIPVTVSTVSCIVPWLNMIVTCATDAQDNQAIFMIDGASGAVIGSFGNTGDLKSGPLDTTYVAEFGITGCGQPQLMIPVQVNTELGTETFIIVHGLDAPSTHALFALKLIAPGLADEAIGTGEVGQQSWAAMYGTADPNITRIIPDNRWTGAIVGSLNAGNIKAMCPGPFGEGGVSYFYYINSSGSAIYRVPVGNAGFGRLLELTAGYETGIAGMIAYYPQEDSVVYPYSSSGNPLRIGKRPANRRATFPFGTTDMSASVDITTASTNKTGFWQQDLAFGLVAIPSSFVGGNSVVEVDLASMTWTDYPAGTALGYGGGWIGDSVGRSMLRISSGGSTLVRNYYDGVQASRTTLKSAIETLALEAGLNPATELDISPEIDDAIDGMIVTERTSFRDVLNRIATIYMLDVVDTGGVIKITKKEQSLSSAAFDFAIGEGELIAGENGAVLESRREEDSVLPRVVELTYLSKANSYTYTVARAQRTAYPEPTMLSENTLSVTLPIAINDVEAKSLAMRVLYQGAWASRVTYQFRLPWKYLYLDPGDVGSIDSGTFSFNVKIKEMVYNNDWTINVKAVGFFSDEPFAIEADGGAGFDQEIIQFSFPRAIIIDAPLFTAGLDSASPANLSTIYSVVYPASRYTTRWSGAYVQVSRTAFGFTGWEDIGDSIDIPAMMSIITPPPNDGAVNMFLERSIVVTPMTGNTADFISTTYEELLEGANAAVCVSRTGNVEVFQFQTVTDNGNNTWTLTGIIRGQRNTDIFAARTDGLNPMQVGSSIILLDSDYVIPNSLPVDTKGELYLYRPGLYGRPENEQPNGTFVFQARGTSSPPPINPELDWQGSPPGTVNLRVLFSNVSRYGTNWSDEEATEYEDDEIMDGTHYVLKFYSNNTFTTATLTIDSPTTLKDSNKRYYIDVTPANLTTAYGTTTPQYVHVGLSRINSRGSTLSLGERQYTIFVPTT